MTEGFQLSSLSHYRFAAGLSQRELATRVGVSYQTIRGYESGGDASNLPLRVLMKIARALRIEPSALLSDQLESPPTEAPQPTLAVDELHLMRKIERGEFDQATLTQQERRVSLPSLIKKGIIDSDQEGPRLTPSVAHSLRPQTEAPGH